MNIIDLKTDIVMELQSLNDDIIELPIYGINISYNNKNYIITVHQGLPIKSIKINNIIIHNYIKCEWCDLLIIPVSYENILNKTIFKHFVKKQMDNNIIFNTSNIKYTYIENIFAPISMTPMNPYIMYNIMEIQNKESDSIHKLKTGLPIYIIDKNKYKLTGIISKIQGNNILSIPINYILTALSKKDNQTIYTLNESFDYIYKINNYKVICNKIYCHIHKTYVPINCYIATNGDSNKIFKIELKNTRIKYESRPLSLSKKERK